MSVRSGNTDDRCHFRNSGFHVLSTKMNFPGNHEKLYLLTLLQKTSATLNEISSVASQKRDSFIVESYSRAYEVYLNNIVTVMMKSLERFPLLKKTRIGTRAVKQQGVSFRIDFASVGF